MSDLPIHVVLGMDETEYELARKIGRSTLGWRGIDVSSEPRWHSHPALGITGHAHSQVEVARSPHTHRQVLQWDSTPIPLDDHERSAEAS